METHRAMRGGRQAEQGLHHFRTTSADQTVKTDNLTAPQTETDVVKFRRMRKMLYLQHDGGSFVVHRRARRKNLSDLAADHQGHQLRFADIGQCAGCDEAAIAQYGIAVCHSKYFIEFM